MWAIETRHLRREFTKAKGNGVKIALGGVNLAVRPGETLGLLGPNGAGKTTLVKILSTVLLPTSGTAAVMGNDVVAAPDRVKPLIGLVFGGDRGLYTQVSARQNLVFWATLYRLSGRRARVRCAQLLEQFGLSDRADEPVERFSRGMKQRLHLARGLIHEPPVIFLDEPTVGLDPAAGRELREILLKLKYEGRTILLATHDMAEAEALCDRVSLIDNGEIKIDEDTATVGRLLSGYDRIDFTCTDLAVVREFADLAGVETVESRGEGGWRSYVSVNDRRRAKLVAWLATRGVADLQTSQPSLEEVYLHVLGNRGMTA